MEVGYVSPLLSRRKFILDDMSDAYVTTAEMKMQLLDELSPLAGGLGSALRKKNKTNLARDSDGHAKIADADITKAHLNDFPFDSATMEEVETPHHNEVSPRVGGSAKACVKKHRRHRKWNIDGHERRVPTILVNGLRVASAFTAGNETRLLDESSLLAESLGGGSLKNGLQKCHLDGHGCNEGPSLPALSVARPRSASCSGAGGSCGFRRRVYQNARHLREEHGNGYTGFEQVARDVVCSVKVCMQTKKSHVNAVFEPLRDALESSAANAGEDNLGGVWMEQHVARSESSQPDSINIEFTGETRKAAHTL
jgi:hypothetical protein